MDAPWLILIVGLLNSFIHCSSIEIVVDNDKIKHVVSPQFLSMTIDPLTLGSAAPFPSQTMEMAKSLSPSYVRIGGFGTNIMHFGKELFKDNTTITEEQIDSIVKFAKEAKLDLIIGLNLMERENGQWHYENSHKLISYMARKGYKASWQLGDNTYNIRMEDLTRDFKRLKKILSMYPIFENSLILGPDFDLIYNAQNFVKKSGSTVSSIVMSLRKDEKIQENIMNDFDMSLNGGMKSVILALKETSEGTFQEAITLAKNLGSAANLGYSMVFRKLGEVALSSPTSEFWFSYLYKMLVGKNVFETKLLPFDGKVKVYSHNTPTETQETLFLDKGKNYNHGALTMFGVNESPEKIELNVDLRKDEDVHLYVLTFDSDEKMTLLNGKKLTMQHGFVPVIAPEVMSTPKIEMPPNSIFFIVRPNANVINSRMDYTKFPIARMMTRISTRAIKPLNVTEILESYKQLTENIQSKMLPNMSKDEDLSISYVTYKDDSWFNKFVEMVSKGENAKERKRRSLEENKTEKDETVGAFFGENEDQREIDQTLLGIVKEGTNSTTENLKESEEESQEETSESNSPVAKDAVDSPIPEESQIIENQKVDSQALPAESAPPESPVVPIVDSPAGPPVFPVPGPSFIPIAIPIDPRSVEEETEKEFEELKNENDRQVDSSHIQKIPGPFVNEKKENMINSILAKIVTTEDAKYANKPVDMTQLDYEDNTAPLVEVVDPVTKEQVFVPMEKLDSGDSISLPDYGPSTTKVQREINTLKEKLLETKKRFGTLGKSKIIPLEESELSKANENLKSFFEERRYDIENIRSKLTEARHKIFDGEILPLKNPDIKSILRSLEESLDRLKPDGGEILPLKNPDIKSILRRLEESLDRLKPKLPSLHEPKLRLRRSAIAKRSIVDDFAQEVDKLKDKFSSFIDDVFGQIKSKTKRSAPDTTTSNPDEQNKEVKKPNSWIDSLLGPDFFKQMDELKNLSKLGNIHHIKKIGKNNSVSCTCKESAALEDLGPNLEFKTKVGIVSNDPSEEQMTKLFHQGLSLISKITDSLDKE